MWGQFLQLKILVVEAVLWAEKELKGKTGPEKKKTVISVVVNKLLAWVSLPWYLSWAKSIASKRLINYLVDLACDKLNFLTDWNFGDIKLTDIQIAELASVIDAPVSVMAVSTSVLPMTVDERLEELYLAYGITQDLPQDLMKSTSKTPADPAVLLPMTEVYDNRLSRNLTRKEVACKCGCGFDILTQATIDTFQALRDYVGKAITITSGCRCPEHNMTVGGVEGSAHTTGQALDMSISGLSNRQSGELVKKAQREGKLPHLKYCYLIAGKTNTAFHVGTDEKRRSGMWGW